MKTNNKIAFVHFCNFTGTCLVFSAKEFTHQRTLLLDAREITVFAFCHSAVSNDTRVRECDQTLVLKEILEWTLEKKRKAKRTRRFMVVRGRKTKKKVYKNDKKCLSWSLKQKREIRIDFYLSFIFIFVFMSCKHFSETLPNVKK